MKRQSGFGLVETLAGLVVFVILVLVGTKAYRNVVANHKDAAQVKALTDAVATTAERLSGMTLMALAGPGSTHLQWSEPAPVGLGPTHYRYRIVPQPAVAGKPDTSVVGLEVEAGTVTGGAFKATRSFGTLIPPNLAAKGALGSVSTKAERDAEAAFHAGLVYDISNLTESVKSLNQKQLNSFNCYKPSECCQFIEKYFFNPGIPAEDGMNEKCLYRCALGGDVPIETWRSECGMDLCTQAPWKNKADCCQAIADGSCKSGSICARVCIDCFGVDGSTCGPPPCDETYWNDYFDCARGTFCDGSPLPDGEVPGWGNVKAWCKQPECSRIAATCEHKAADCCENYWRPLKAGQPIPAAFEVCAKISTQQECCNWEVQMGNWTLHCGTDGNLRAAKLNGQWYCTPPTPAWHDNCKMMMGCGSTVTPAGSPGGGCQAWTGLPLESPWMDPATGQWPGGSGTVGTGGGGGGTVITKDGGGGGGRKGTTRDGDGNEGRGGRE